MKWNFGEIIPTIFSGNELLFFFLHAVVAKLIKNIFYIDDTFHDDITIFESEGFIRKTKM